MGGINHDVFICPKISPHHHSIFLSMKWMALLFSLIAGFAQAQTFLITSYGAKGDGKTLNTPFIQKTINACAEAGGGTVWIPSGVFLCGAIELKSNITIHLDNGATLLGSPDLKDYPKRPVFIYGEQLRNVAFGGKGIIDGNGKAFFNDDWTHKARPEPWIKFYDSHQITFRDIQLLNSPAHVLDFTECDGVNIDGINISNDMRSPNTDGIDIRNTRNVRISNCYIETGDDAICLKTSYKSTAPKYFTENVVVNNCILKSDDAALKLGTGSAYLTRNCIFSNCVIQDTRFAIALFMEEGGRIENYQFNNIIIQGKSRHKTEYPIYIDIDKKKQEYSFGTIQGVRFNNITIETRGNILIGGQKSAWVEDIVLENIKLHIKNAVDLKDMKKPKGNKSVPRWADSDDFASENAHVMIGNARNITLRNFKIYDDKSGTTRQSLSLKNTENVQKQDFEEK
jgi:polygalacturonase